MHTFLLFVLVCMLQGLESLRYVRLEAPIAVKKGSFMTLSCAYRLDHDALYAIKLYLEDTEFFRFVPRDRPPAMVFPLQDASVHLQMCSLNRSVVTLGPMHRGLAGVYKCEVTEEPLFHTVIRSSFVTVTEDPVSWPTLVTSKGFGKGGEGETLTAKCTSRGGHPPVNFTWFLDGRQIGDLPGDEIRNYIVPGDVDTSISELRLAVTPITSLSQEWRLRCVVSQFDLYHEVAERFFKKPTSPSPPTNKTCSLICIPTQYLSLILLFCNVLK